MRELFLSVVIFFLSISNILIKLEEIIIIISMYLRKFMLVGRKVLLFGYECNKLHNNNIKVSSYELGRKLGIKVRDIGIFILKVKNIILYGYEKDKINNKVDLIQGMFVKPLNKLVKKLKDENLLKKYYSVNIVYKELNINNELVEVNAFKKYIDKIHKVNISVYKEDCTERIMIMTSNYTSSYKVEGVETMHTGLQQYGGKGREVHFVTDKIKRYDIKNRKDIDMIIEVIEHSKDTKVVEEKDEEFLKKKINEVYQPSLEDVEEPQLISKNCNSQKDLLNLLHDVKGKMKKD